MANPAWPFSTEENQRRFSQMQPPLTRVESVDSQASSVKKQEVIGTTELYDENGNVRLIPMPTPDPKDPLNLPNWKKWTSIGVMSFFGSLALSAEIIIGAQLPVFLLEYSGVDPRILNTVNFKEKSGGSALFSPLAVVPDGVKPAPLGQVSLLAAIPLLTNGIASYFLVPLSIAIGRRPVLLLTGVCAWVGGLWAGLSTSLMSHIIARALQGLGAGAVEALIPLIVQDMMFIHQRNRAMSTVVSSQGVIIIALGIAAPWVSSNFTWRLLYFFTSGFGILAWLLMIAFVPETRWKRSKEELGGARLHPIAPGEDRPRLEPHIYGRRTLWSEIGFFQFGTAWGDAGKSMLETLWTTWFPAIIWATLANSAFIIVNQGAAQLGSFALLSQGWQFQYTGLAVVPFVIATVMVYFVGGPLADRVANTVAKWHGGSREPEYHLPNLILPFIFGIVGCFVFGYAGETGAHWSILLLGSFFIVFGFLTTMTVMNVFMVESYPMWAGPVLVNVSSLRIIIAFFFAEKITEWVAENGIMKTFVMFAEALIVISLGLPALFFWGKKIRGWTAGSIRRQNRSKNVEKEESVYSTEKF